MITSADPVFETRKKAEASDRERETFVINCAAQKAKLIERARKAFAEVRGIPAGDVKMAVDDNGEICALAMPDVVLERR